LYFRPDKDKGAEEAGNQPATAPQHQPENKQQPALIHCGLKSSGELGGMSEVLNRQLHSSITLGKWEEMSGKQAEAGTSNPGNKVAVWLSGRLSATPQNG